MPTSLHTKTSDPLGRYYTQSMVASLLVTSMRSSAPTLAIDLGAGDGALVSEASKIWKATQFVTVDIDSNAGSVSLAAQNGSAFRHHIGDALDRYLHKKLDLSLGQADVALCNPPYIRPCWQKHFSEILEDAGLSHVLPKIQDAPSDLLFIAQNLRFLKSGGRLGLILPDGLIAGEKYAKFRETLASNHKIERVIELPRRIFKNTDAKAHVLVLSKDVKDEFPISVQRIEQNGSLSSPIALTADAARQRMDYSFYSGAGASPSKGNEIRAYGISVRRGAYSSAQRNNFEFPVFHTTDFCLTSDWMPSRFSVSKKVAAEHPGVFAQAGDILVARVGRNLESKICMVRRGAALVTDCILVLRVLPEFRKPILSYLRSDAGQAALHRATHGVAARFITPDALLSLEFPL